MTFLRSLKRLSRRTLARFGFELRRLPPASPGIARPDSELARVLARLRALGVAPRTVFDVGVAHGTPELYAAWTEALHVLVEPLEEFRADLDQLSEHHRTRIVPMAAGAQPGRRRIHVHRDLLGSSLLREVEGPMVDGSAREIAVTTIDAVVREHGLEGPFVVKIDVQGAELEVLEGASRTLASTDAVLLEASLFRFFEGGPILDEVLAWMKSRGFVAWDLWGRLERPLDGALAQIDLVFVREEGPLRRDPRFAAPGQRES